MIFEQEADTRISIHALVKRATRASALALRGSGISIHALVKRATNLSLATFGRLKHFNPRPREEGD